MHPRYFDDNCVYIEEQSLPAQDPMTGILISKFQRKCLTKGEIPMFRIPHKWRMAAPAFFTVMILLFAFSTLSFAQGYRYKSERAWSFGVFGDTQWTLGNPDFVKHWEDIHSQDVWRPENIVDPAGNNPEFVSASVASQIYEEFVDPDDQYDIKFVIQVGDLTNWAGDDAIAVANDTAGVLYDAAIGYFPMRGNHETYGYWGLNRDPKLTYCIPAFRANFPQTRGEGETFGARNFSSPVIDEDKGNWLRGMSYSFDYGYFWDSARFLIIDPWPTGDYSTENNMGHGIGEQQSWIDERLDVKRRRTAHAFVFSHQPLMGQNHGDTAFGDNVYRFLEDQKEFYKSLQENRVGYYISGHDHIYQRSVITSPDEGANPDLNGEYSVEALIAQSASSKFYSPKPLNHSGFGDNSDQEHTNQKHRETPVSQEMNNLGYYVYTIDGPRVTVDYYADADNGFLSDADYPYDGSNITPDLNFVKKESWGYSLNGKKFLVAQGEHYNVVRDRYWGTRARIIAGINESEISDASTIIDDNGTPENPDDDSVVPAPRPLTKVVSTGWTSQVFKGHELYSDIFSLWGMAELGTDQTDLYVLSMRHDFPRDMLGGKAGISALNAQGEWVNAVTLNIGEDNNPRPNPVFGPYNPSKHVLGDWGVDPKTKSAWAVLDYNADFAIARFDKKIPASKKPKPYKN